MLSHLSVRKIPDCRLRRLSSLATSMDATPLLQTKASLNQSLATLLNVLYRCPSYNDLLPPREDLAGMTKCTEASGLPPLRRLNFGGGGRLRSPVRPPTCPLRPVMADNTCPLRITATAGTKLVGAYFSREIIIFPGVRRDSGPGPAGPASVGLRPEGLHLTSPTAQAGSGFRPLSKIPHCCPGGRKLVSISVWRCVLTNPRGILG